MSPGGLGEVIMEKEDKKSQLAKIEKVFYEAKYSFNYLANFSDFIENTMLDNSDWIREEHIAAISYAMKLVIERGDRFMNETESLLRELKDEMEAGNEAA